MLLSAPSKSDFYPRPPRGGRLDVDSFKDNEEFISIHALREEGDTVTTTRKHQA